jgi:hypothetical protein
MVATSSIGKLKGTWELVASENFDNYMQEIVRRFSCFLFIRIFVL